MMLNKLGLAGFLLGVSMATQAGEGLFGWVYTLDIQPKGQYEFEQRVQWNHRQEGGDYENFALKTEIEYGLTNDVQIAGYINTDYMNAKGNDRFGETAGSHIPESIDVSKRFRNFRYESASAELIWRILNPYTDVIGLGIYVEPTLGYDNKSIEYRVLLQKNLIDDRLVMAANLQFETERDEFATNTDFEKASHADLLLGASYRFAPNWNAGFDYRYHNDFSGYFYQESTQHAHFIGPNIHYASKDWWTTIAWRHQIHGDCHGVGKLECSSGYVNDDHGRDEFMFKVGVPF